MASIVTLTAYNMGDVTEEQFLEWARFVDSEIDEAFGERVYVDCLPLDSGTSADVFRLGPDETGERAERMRETLSALWERFCAEGAEVVA